MKLIKYKMTIKDILIILSIIIVFMVPIILLYFFLKINFFENGIPAIVLVFYGICVSLIVPIIYHPKDGLPEDTIPLIKWNLPYIRNPNFTGRKPTLNKIKKAFSSLDGEYEAIVCLYGLGGVGKTQICIEYAYENLKYHKLIWWLRAENSDSLEHDYLDLLSVLNLQYDSIDKEKLDKEKLIGMVKNKLENTDDWLLIFDNAKSQESINDYLPKSKTGHVLITSRNNEWQIIDPDKIISVKEYNRDESIEYISKRLAKHDSKKPDMNNLAQLLDDFPLALSQACSYILASGRSITEYIEMFNNYPKEILTRGKEAGYPETIATTWAISFEAVKKECPDGIYLLYMCSFLASDEIPMAIINNISSYLPEECKNILSNDLSRSDAIASLKKYSFIQYENKMLSMHRLVQLVTRNNLDEDKKNIWIRSLIKTMNAVMPSNIQQKENREIFWGLLPHISNIIKFAGENRDEDILILIDKVGSFLNKTSYYKNAIMYYEQNLKNFLEIDNKRAESKGYTDLGNAYDDLGDHEKAIEYYEKCLNIDIEIGDRSGEAKCYGNLGIAYSSLGDYEKAIEYQEKSMNFFIEFGDRLGEAKCYISIGNIYDDLGDSKKAIEYYEKSLELFIELCDRVGEAKCYNGLGNAYISLKDYEKAIEYFEKSLKIALETGDRLNESNCYNGLGNAYNGLGDFKKAIEYYKKASTGFKKIGHKPYYKIAQNNISNLNEKIKSL